MSAKLSDSGRKIRTEKPYINVRATDVVWLSPVLVCAFTVMLTVVLLEDVGLLELKPDCPPQPMVLPPNATRAMKSIESASSRRNSLRLFDEIQNSKGKKARASCARERLAEFELAVCAVV